MKKILLVVLMFSCVAAHASRFIPVDSDQVGGLGLIVSVVDEAGGIQGATVWVENRDGVLLAKGTTGADGRFFAEEVNRDVLEQGTAVTAFAEGFAPVSFVENISNRVRIELPRNLPDTYPIIDGQITGFDPDDGSAYAKVGIVAKALGVADLGQLDSSAFVSPINDKISVYGERDIPSNIVLPDQWFTVGIVPIHVSKPNYRLPVAPGSSNRYLALSGNAHAGRVIDALRNNMSYKMLDNLNVTRVGISEVVRVGLAKKAHTTVKIAAETKLDGIINFRRTPGLSDYDSSLYDIGQMKHMIGALWEPYPGVFVPTDVKFLEQEQKADEIVKLKTIKGTVGRVLNLVVEGTGGAKFRGQWLDPTKGIIPKSRLTAVLDVQDYSKDWRISSGDECNLMVARVQHTYKSSIKSNRLDDKWVVVSPFAYSMQLPARAFEDLGSNLGTVNAVSVDLLQTRSGGYPFVHGENAAAELVVLEKVYKELK